MVQMTLVSSKGARTAILLKGVLHVPAFLTIRVLVSCLQEKGVYWRSDNFTFWMTKTNAEIVIRKLVGSLFVLQTNKAQDFAIVTKAVQTTWQKPTWELLHAPLGHLSIEEIKKLSKITTRFEILLEHPSFFCELFVLAKQVRHVSHQPSKRETQALAMVHTNVIGSITPTGYDDSRYYLLLTDDATRITEGELFKIKSQVQQAIPRYTNKIERQLKLKLKDF